MIRLITILTAVAVVFCGAPAVAQSANCAAATHLIVWNRALPPGISALSKYKAELRAFLGDSTLTGTVLVSVIDNDPANQTMKSICVASKSDIDEEIKRRVGTNDQLDSLADAGRQLQINQAIAARVNDEKKRRAALYDGLISLLTPRANDAARPDILRSATTLLYDHCAPVSTCDLHIFSPMTELTPRTMVTLDHGDQTKLFDLGRTEASYALQGLPSADWNFPIPVSIVGYRINPTTGGEIDERLAGQLLRYLQGAISAIAPNSITTKRIAFK